MGGRSLRPQAQVLLSGSTPRPCPSETLAGRPRPVFGSALCTQSLQLHPNSLPAPKRLPPTRGGFS